MRTYIKAGAIVWLLILCGCKYAIGQPTSVAVTCETGCSQSVQYNSNGTLKSATEVGSSLVIDEWKCNIRKDFGETKGIRCDNTSEYCVKLFAKVKAWEKRIFGCAVKDNPNYPCNFDDINPMEVDEIDATPVSRQQMLFYNHGKCGPHGVGSFLLDAQ